MKNQAVGLASEIRRSPSVRLDKLHSGWEPLVWVTQCCQSLFHQLKQWRHCISPLEYRQEHSPHFSITPYYVCTASLASAYFVSLLGWNTHLMTKSKQRDYKNTHMWLKNLSLQSYQHCYDSTFSATRALLRSVIVVEWHSEFHFIPKVLNGVEVRALAALCMGTLSC